MKVKSIPEGYTTVTPYIMVENAPATLEFIQNGLGGKVTQKFVTDEGEIRNMEIQIGTGKVMLAEARGMDPMPAFIYLYVEDVNAVYAKCMEAGGISMVEPHDAFYGDRNAGVSDSTGNVWWLATRIEDVSEEELMRRFREQTSKQ